MRKLSNGYGLFHSQEEKKSFILNPSGLEKWENSDQTLESALELIEGGQGSVLSTQQLQNLTSATGGHPLLV